MSLARRVRAYLLFYGARVLIGLYPLNLLFILTMLSLYFALIYNNMVFNVLTLLMLILTNYQITRAISAKRKLQQTPKGEVTGDRMDSKDVYLIHLDNSLNEYKSQVDHSLEVDLRKWGNKIRVTGSFSDFLKFEKDLHQQIKGHQGICFFGHNDFDHVTLSLLRRISTPFNLILFDAHADWHTLYPHHIMCGSWVMNAFKSSNIQNLFHVGGREGAFDSESHWWDSAECFGSSLTMQQYIDQERVSLLPSDRSFSNNSFFNYGKCFNKPLLKNGTLDTNTLNDFLETNREKLQKYPLYIAIDKDVLREEDNIQTWKEGVLSTEQLAHTLGEIKKIAKDNIIGASICGEHSPSSYQSIFHPGNILELLTKLIYKKNSFNNSPVNQNYTTNSKILKALQKQEEIQ